jgi:hypothetical protein
MKKYLMFVSILISSTIIFSCGRSLTKPPSGEERVEIPCFGNEYATDKRFYRASAVGTSVSLNGAIGQAKIFAKTNLAEDVRSNIKTITEGINSSTTVTNREQDGEAIEMFGTLTQNVANIVIEGPKTVCSVTTKDRSTGYYKYYMAIEVSKDDVFSQLINGLNDENRKKAEAKRNQLREIFDKEFN